MASSLAWMSILPATAVFAQSTPTVTPGSVSLSGPIHPTNGSATFTANASDPGGTPEYQFWVESPTGTWSDMQNYSTTNTFTLATPSAGDYLVVVDVMDQAQVAAGEWNMAQTTAPDAVFNGSTVSVMSNASGEVAKGTSVTLTATSSGIFDPLYQFWYQAPDGIWYQSGAYSSSNSFTFTAGQSGPYKYVAYAKSPAAANDQYGALESTVGTQVAYGTASQVVLSLASPTVVADGTAKDMLTATVEDSHGDTVANFSGSVMVFASGGLISSGSGSVTITNGTGMFPLGTASDTSDGNNSYTVTSDNLISTTFGEGGTATQGQVANVTYGSATVTTTAPSDNSLGLQSTLPNLESNAQSSTTVWVQLKDSTGAPYTTANGQYVNLTLSGTASGSFSPSSSQTTATIEVASGTFQFPVTVYSENGSNGTITVTAQSEDPTVTPLNAASISIPVVEVGNPAAVEIRQIGTTMMSGRRAVVYQADVVDANGNTISLGSVATGSGYIQDNSRPAVNPNAELEYWAYTETPTGFANVSGTTPDYGAGPNTGKFSGGMVDIAVATVHPGNGTPLTLTVHDSTSKVSGTTTWNFAPPMAGYTETLPVYAGAGLSEATVTAGETVMVSAQLTNNYGNAVQEAGQPIWFSLVDSGVATLPNGASQSGDTYEAFTNSQGIASVAMNVLGGTVGQWFELHTAGVLGGNYSAVYNVVSPSNYATTLTLSGAVAQATGGEALPSLTAVLKNALGGPIDSALHDEVLIQSSNSGVVSIGSGSSAVGGEIIPATTSSVTALSGDPSGFAAGLFAGSVGTATITVTDVSNAAMPSASFTVKVVPGTPLTTPWIEYQGQQVSSVNEVPLPANTPVELQVVNVDAGGNPIDVTGTTPLAVELPVLPSGEYWQASSGGVSSSSMTVDIKPGQSSANVWLVSSTAAKVSGPAYGQDLSAEAMAIGATVMNFTQATTSSNGSMTVDLAYDASLASGTVAPGSAFTVTDSAVSSATLSGTAAAVSGGNMVALTVTIPSGSTDATVTPFNNFTVTTSSSAVDSTANGSDYATAPVLVSTSGTTDLPGLSTSNVSLTAAGESQNLNQAGDSASASSITGSMAYSAYVSDFALLSTGGAAINGPITITSGSVSSGSATVSNQDLYVFYTANTGYTYLDLTNEAPPSGATGSAYVGFEFTGSSSVSIWSANSSGVIASDSNTGTTDYLYVAVATGTTGSSSGWVEAPYKTITVWVEVNGTYYQFVTNQP